MIQSTIFRLKIKINVPDPEERQLFEVQCEAFTGSDKFGYHVVCSYTVFYQIKNQLIRLDLFIHLSTDNMPDEADFLY